MFSVFLSVGGLGHVSPENSENLMLRNAISRHFCDIFVKKFSSLHSIFTRLQYRRKHYLNFLFMIRLAISHNS